MKTVTFLSLALLLATPIAAQSNPYVFFVPSRDVERWCYTANSCCFQVIGNRNVAVVQKNTCQDCAVKLTPEVAWNTLAGDADNDAVYHDSGLFGEIDALLFKRMPATQANMRHMFISPKARLGTAVSGTPGLRPGDVGAIVRTAGGGDGQVVHFLRAEQVRAALGFAGPLSAIDVDAIAADDAGNVYFSLDADLSVTLDVAGVPTPFMLLDGSIVVIPASAITYDARGNVAAVTGRSAMILRTEAQVDAMVALSGVANHTGACVGAAGDVEGLEIDPNGGSQTLSWGGVVYTFPDLAFTAESLTGLGVLTTAAGGSILRFPATGCCLARVCGGGGLCPGNVTTGFEMGVQKVGGGAAPAHAIALAIRTDLAPCAFFVETCTPSVTAPALVNIGVYGGATPTVLLIGLGPTSPGGVAPSTPTPFAPFSCHPDIYLAGHLTTIPMASTTLALPIPAAAAGNLVLQGLTINPVTLTPEVSTPGTLVVN